MEIKYITLTTPDDQKILVCTANIAWIQNSIEANANACLYFNFLGPKDQLWSMLVKETPIQIKTLIEA